MKLLRKIAPLAITCLFLGTTAAAADLGSWKASFPGTDTAIVIGSNAAAQDTIGAVDIANAMGVSQGGSAPVAGAHLIEAPGNDLNYNEDFVDVEVAGLDDRDLPTLLADGTYRESRGETENEETYTQTIEFAAGTDTIVYDAEEDAPEATDTYLFIDDGADAYTYTLEFDNAIEYNTDDAATMDEDFELSKIKILGREYTIVDAEAPAYDGTDTIDDIVMMAGAVKASQWEYSKASYTLGNKTYEVEVKIVSDDDSTAILVVNGEETDEMEEGDTYTLDDGTRVGVVDVVPNEGAEKSTGTAEGNDLCTFFLGAEKIEFEDGAEVEINGVAIEGSNVAYDAADNELTGITLTITPDDPSYLAKGESWTDPVLGRFKYTLQGLDPGIDVETITASSSGDDGTVELENNAGDELEIPVIMDDANDIVYPGDELLDVNMFCTVQDGDVAALGTGGGGNLLVADADIAYVDGAGTLLDLEGLKLLAVSEGGEARILEIDDIDLAADTLDVTDEYGNTWDDESYLAAIDLTGFTEITLTVDEAIGDDGCDAGGAGADDFKITATTINNFNEDNAVTVGTSWQTSLAGEMGIEYDGAEVEFHAFENDGTDLLAGGGAWTFDDDTAGAGGDLVITEDEGGALAWTDLEEDSDFSSALDDESYGAIFTVDEENDDDLTFTYPDEQEIVKAYISEELTTIPELGQGGGTGAATPVLDTEVADVKDKNLIVIGGTGINKVAAEALKVTFPTYGSDSAWTNATGVDAAGKAVVKLMDSPYTTGKFAMLVAGWEGVDTARASKVLKEGTPALSGQKVLLNTATSTVTVITA